MFEARYKLGLEGSRITVLGLHGMGSGHACCFSCRRLLTLLIRVFAHHDVSPSRKRGELVSDDNPISKLYNTDGFR